MSLGCSPLPTRFTRCLPPPPGEKIVQLIMEYVPLGSLRDYLPKHNVSLAHILLFAQQICEVKPKPSWLLLGAPLLPQMALTSLKCL